MNVQVRVLVSTEPGEKDLDNMKAAAQSLTDNINSISLAINKSDCYYELIANFTIKRTAQYKVVDDIAHRFKFYIYIGGLADYQDMLISFPKTTDEIKRQKRRQQTRKQ